MHMNRTDAYNLCCQYHGKRVRITDNTGRVHRGEITRVTNRMVYIQPDGVGGYGLGFVGLGFGYGIALGAITGIALASPFFWW